MDLGLCTLFLYGAVILFLLFITLCLVLFATTKPYPNVQRAEEEKYYTDPTNGERHVFPSLSDKCSIHLSVVVPAYDEEVRLPPMLDECLEYLQTRPPHFRYEILVVSDGSRDKTADVARSYTRRCGPDVVRVLELKKNRGKGGAVRLGIQSARGAVILFADADGATKFSDLSKLEASLRSLTGVDYTVNPEGIQAKNAIVCGSRAHMEQEAIASRSYFRTILMHGFHFLVWLFAVRSLRDTQCGFKVLSRQAAKLCFASMHVERWAFDVELLYIAERLKMPISEIPVNWTEIEGSKVVPVWSWLQMGKDLFLIWLRYRIGVWRLVEKIE